MRKMQVVCGEVLFMLDFSMDFCALYFAQRLRGKPIRSKRIMIASAICAAAGVAAVAIGFPMWLQLISGIASAAVSYTVAANIRLMGKSSFFDLAVGVFLFWLLEIAAGGLMTAAFALLNRQFLHWGIILANTKQSHMLFWLTSAILFFILSILTRLRRRECENAYCKRNGTVVIQKGKNQLSMPCLFDSGCLAKEPLSGLPVIVLPKKSRPDLGIPEMLPDGGSAVRCRAVPISTISGKHMLYWAIHPDRITISEDGTDVSSMREVDAYVIFSENTELAIVPMCLCISDK